MVELFWMIHDDFVGGLLCDDRCFINILALFHTEIGIIDEINAVYLAFQNGIFRTVGEREGIIGE